jgi:hypothetical protein
MFTPDYIDEQMAKEYHKDLLREAAEERRAQEALGSHASLRRWLLVTAIITLAIAVGWMM